MKDCSCVTNFWYKYYGEKHFSSFIMTSSCKSALVRSSLSINALRACVYIQQLSSFRVPKLWCIDLTVATCHIQCNFLSLCEFFFTRKLTKQKNIRSPKMAAAGCLACKALILRASLSTCSSLSLIYINKEIQVQKLEYICGHTNPSH